MGLLDCNDMVVGHQSFVASMVFGGVVIILRAVSHDPPTLYEPSGLRSDRKKQAYKPHRGFAVESLQFSIQRADL